MNIITLTPYSTVLQSNRFHTLENVLNHPLLRDTHIVLMQQVHSATITPIEPNGHMTILNTDGVITTTPNTTLIVKTADCLPILIAQPNGTITAIHAGRKGTENGILSKTLNILLTTYHLQTCSIWFGPHICVDCYQINRENNLHYDLVEENKKQIKKILNKSQYKLTVSDECTSCSNDLYYSYRKDAPLNSRLNYSAITNKC